MEELKHLTYDEMDKAWELFNKWAMNERGVNPYAWRQSVRNKRKKGGNFTSIFLKLA